MVTASRISVFVAFSLCLIFITAKAEEKTPGDPCAKDYRETGTKEREVHVNLGKKAIRVFTKAKSGVSFEEYSEIIFGTETSKLARDSGWCHMHVITAKLPGPTSKHGLLNFAVFCPKLEIGFHSDHHMVNGEKIRIPGGTSAGCIRIPDSMSKKFFDSIKEGDCVRIYEQSDFWREPTFAKGETSKECRL